MFAARRNAALAITTAALLGGAPAAQASSSTVAGYSTPAGTSQGDVAGVESVAPSDGPAVQASATEPQTIGGLPFTGLDLLMTGGAGIVLLGTGLTLRATVLRARREVRPLH